jgi:asparagine N-glycosylation enzyme membrane subunit Stt3
MLISTVVQLTVFCPSTVNFLFYAVMLMLILSGYRLWQVISLSDFIRDVVIKSFSALSKSSQR